MKRFLTLCLLVCISAISLTGCQAPPTAIPTPVPPTSTPVPPTPTMPPPTLTAADVVSKLHWFATDTSSILYRGSKIIYFDPVTLGGDLPPADVILVTHAHSDHWSPVDIKQIIGPNTILIISPNVVSAYEASKEALGIPAKVLDEGETTEANGVSVQAVPAYTNDGGHPRDQKGMGYIVGVDGVRLYLAGAADAYPEMAQYQCDVALIPVYTRERASALAAVIPAKTFVFEHVSVWVVQSLVTLATKEFNGQKTFMYLVPGPNTP
jgi:L-ascorbate metabolism protein UlaG (beta-lactamase superfamily)